MLAVDDMIAPLSRLGDDASAPRFKNTRRHTRLLSNNLSDNERIHGTVSWRGDERRRGSPILPLAAEERASQSRSVSRFREAVNRFGNT
jgi:hypothetical protein